MAPLIARADVEARLGATLAAPETVQVDGLIVYGSARLRRLVPKLDDRLAAWGATPRPESALDPDLVTGTMVSAVIRALTDLRVGPRVLSEEFPEIRTTYSASGADESGLFFTDAELDDLSYIPAANSGQTAYMISTIPVRSATA